VITCRAAPLAVWLPPLVDVFQAFSQMPVFIA
jgi:hypothetical protein